MKTPLEKFCQAIRNRTKENRLAMKSFNNIHLVLSPAISILRQEVDSMVRVIYLQNTTDPAERARLIKLTLSGEKWNYKTAKGKYAEVKDRQMVDLAQGLHGWTRSVYDFGCAFVHLSNKHDHLSENPFGKLPASEREDILKHMRQYHGGPAGDNPTIEELSEYVPRIFEKISTNLEDEIQGLEALG